MNTSTAKHFLIAFTVFALASIARGGELVELAKSTGVQGGLIVHVGCGDAAQTATLRWNDRFLVQGLDVNEADVQAARKKLLAAGRYGPVSVAAFDGAASALRRQSSQPDHRQWPIDDRSRRDPARRAPAAWRCWSIRNRKSAIRHLTVGGRSENRGRPRLTSGRTSCTDRTTMRWPRIGWWPVRDPCSGSPSRGGAEATRNWPA